MAALELIFGDVATRAKTRRFMWIASIVIGLDLFTKLLALWLAPVDVPLMLWNGAIEIRRIENARLLGSAVEKAGNLSQLLVSGLVGLVLAAVALASLSARDRPWKKALVISAVLLGAALAFKLPVSFLTMSNARLVGISRTLGTVACDTLLLRVLLNKRLFSVVSLLASASLANLTNAIWHPAGIIDFIWIRAFREVLGVANLADWVMVLTCLWLEFLLAAWLLIELLWRFSPTRPRRKALRALLFSKFDA